VLLGFTDTFADKNILQSVSLSDICVETHQPAISLSPVKYQDG